MWCERKISPGNHYRLNIFPTRVPEVVNYCEYIYIFHTTSSEKNPLNIFKDYYDITRVLEVSMNIHIFHVTHNDLCLAAAGHETSLENLSSSVFRIYLFQASSIITIVLEVIMENLVCCLDVTFGMRSAASHLDDVKSTSIFVILWHSSDCKHWRLILSWTYKHVGCSSNTQEEE